MALPSLNCDVFVAGAGPSGTAAAVAAARSGCRVLLVETTGRLGGIAVQAPLHRICGLYGTGRETPPSLLNDGLGEEIAVRLNRLRPEVSRPVPMGRLQVLPFHAPDLEKILGDMVAAEETLKVLYNTRAVSLSCHKGRVEEVMIVSDGKPLTVTTAVLIDATGNAGLSALAGAGVVSTDAERRQMGGYVVRLEGCTPDDLTGVRVPFSLHEAAERGVVPRCFRFTAWEPEENSSDRGFLKFSVPASVELPEAFARRNSEKAIAYLRACLPAFRSARVEGTSERVIAREAQRIEGEYVLTEQDVLSGRKFEDAVAKNAWPVEFWHPQRGPVYKYLVEGDYYEIPFRCLKPVGVRNLLATGMCLSAEQGAQASARVMGPCIALGDQAGQAAAGFAAHGRWRPQEPFRT